MRNKNKSKNTRSSTLTDAFCIIMLGSFAAGMKHSFFTRQIYHFTYLNCNKSTKFTISHILIAIKAALETVKEAILIKCMKHTWNALAA